MTCCTVSTVFGALACSGPACPESGQRLPNMSASSVMSTPGGGQIGHGRAALNAQGQIHNDKVLPASRPGQ